ncbi:uncharacterized protein VTP21DRAFT_11519 [Calcarisporiella thermophila]|uniref:uncharacterized protein n=1 Tax=Calcarisporiella thermophila TaxID=911321 RepID=UPI0037428A7A
MVVPHWEYHPPNFSAFKSTASLTPAVRRHLVQVYSTLSLLSVISGWAAWSRSLGSFIAGDGLLSSIGLMISMGMLAVLRPTPENRTLRFGILAAFAFFQGVALGSLVEYIWLIDYSGQILFNALVTTAIVFASFTGSALLSQRRSWLYIGGILSSAVSLMSWLAFFNWFVGSTALYNVELYAGLMVFCGYVVYDTQLIIERASAGYGDVIRHCMELYVDLIAIFVRILIILAKQREQENRDKRRQAERRRRG